MNTAIDHFILHEISALRGEEHRLNAALACAPTNVSTQRFILAIASLEARIANLDSVLEQLAIPHGISEPGLHAA